MENGNIWSGEKEKNGEGKGRKISWRRKSCCGRMDGLVDVNRRLRGTRGPKSMRIHVCNYLCNANAFQTNSQYENKKNKKRRRQRHWEQFGDLATLVSQFTFPDKLGLFNQKN